MENREGQGLSLLPLQDVVISQILPLLSPRDWCALRAVDSDHLQIVTAFIAANRRLELPYCKQLTEAGLSLLTAGSTCLRSLTLSGRFPLGKPLSVCVCCFLLFCVFACLCSLHLPRHTLHNAIFQVASCSLTTFYDRSSSAFPS